ncbi:MAG: hypothetical protein NTV01_10075 [Bacteroidia bacterium]|nr:hypothetical protein [Bacteroidia bacterium]
MEKMNPSDPEFSPEESIELINKMLTRAKLTVEQGSFHMILWGWLISAICLGHFLLMKFTDLQHPYFIWWLTIIGGLISGIYGFRKGSRSIVRTYAGYVHMWVWMGFLISGIILFILLLDRPWVIGAFILMLAGYATFLSGIIIKFRPMIIGGILLWLSAVAAHFLDQEYALLINAIAIFLGYLVPGYMLRKKVRNGTI